MNMDEMYSRRIRIEGGMDETSGRRLHVYDIETGEAITNIMSISIFLNAREESIADVVYCEIDENGKYRQIAGKPIAETKRLVNPEIAVTAFEGLKRNDDRQKIRDTAQKALDTTPHYPGVLSAALEDIIELCKGE